MGSEMCIRDRGGGGAVIKNVREKRKRGMFFFKAFDCVCVAWGGGGPKRSFSYIMCL